MAKKQKNSVKSKVTSETKKKIERKVESSDSEIEPPMANDSDEVESQSSVEEPIPTKKKSKTPVKQNKITPKKQTPQKKEESEEEEEEEEEEDEEEEESEEDETNVAEEESEEEEESEVEEKEDEPEEDEEEEEENGGEEEEEDDNEESMEVDEVKEKKKRKADQSSESNKKIATSEETKIVVKGLSFDSTEAEVKSFFKDCGKMDEFHMPRRPDGASSRGICFITFATKKGADSALRKSGMTLHGRSIIVIINRPFDHVDENNITSVFVSNLPDGIEENEINTHFESCGKIEEIFLHKDRETDEFNGKCFITFENSSGAKAALKLDGTSINDTEISVLPRRSKPFKQGGGRGGFDRGRGRGNFERGRGGWGGRGPRGAMRGGRGRMRNRA